MKKLKRIGFIDVDKGRFPNLAIMKLAAWHQQQGDAVGWYDIFGDYDRVYLSKVFSFTPDYPHPITNAAEVVRGGTGYGLMTHLPDGAEHITPLYSLYPDDDGRTAYGFLTRGCPNRCKWCVVPEKEGPLSIYEDVEHIAAGGRDRLVLMDNNILAAGTYAEEQLEKIIAKGYKVDFNQGLEARLVTERTARLLAQVSWLKYIRFGCDYSGRIKECERAISMVEAAGYKGEFMLYTLLQGDITECLQRIVHWKGHPAKVTCFAQPYRDCHRKNQQIPQWQKDMARWCNRKELFKSFSFEDYEPRKGFKCAEYLSGKTQKGRK